MASAEDRSTISMPRGLVLAAVILLTARAIVWAADFSHPVSVPPAIAWNELSALEGKVLPTNKLMLFEFYADWCGPCKRMEVQSLGNSEVRDLIVNKFIPVRVTDRAREDGKNPDAVAALQKRYRVFAFPTLVVVDRQGEPIGSLVGNCSSLTTYRFLSRAVHSTQPNSI